MFLTLLLAIWYGSILKKKTVNVLNIILLFSFLLIDNRKKSHLDFTTFMNILTTWDNFLKNKI